MMRIDHCNTGDDLSCWLRLLQIEGIGSETARRLLTVFGLPSVVFIAGIERLREVVPERLARALAAPPSALMCNRIERALEWSTQPGHRLITLADADYPPSLLHIADPPILLYVQGRVALLAAPTLAIVGSRNATAQGMLNAERFAEAVSHAGVTVASGLALGIDAAAHQGGLRGIGASIAVIGTGIDIVYPARNHGLAQRLAQDGCIVSEYMHGMPPLAANFPRRNRIISGLARAVLVVEAAAQSGSLITARVAAEQGRDVLAIPGSIHAPLSKGCHLLIKQGAKLVESADDILEELGHLSASATSPAGVSGSAPTLLESSDMLLQAIGFDPVDADVLSANSGLDAAALQVRLLQLELEGVLECLSGGRYRRIQ